MGLIPLTVVRSNGLQVLLSYHLIVLASMGRSDGSPLPLFPGMAISFLDHFKEIEISSKACIPTTKVSNEEANTSF